jgi:hypothetical protein
MKWMKRENEKKEREREQEERNIPTVRRVDA